MEKVIDGESDRHAQKTSERSATKAEFSRNPTIETSAVEKLGYTVDEVKRMTITSLTKELEAYNLRHAKPSAKERDDEEEVDGRRSTSPLRSALKKPSSDRRQFSVSFGRDLDDANDPQPDRRPSSGRAKDGAKSSSRRERRDDSRASAVADDVSEDDPAELYNLYMAKCKFRRQLERDPDFTDADLRDWDQSTERTRKRIEILLDGDDVSGDIEARWERWERRQEKLREMTEMGLLDPDLAAKWQQKQALLRKFLEHSELAQ